MKRFAFFPLLLLAVILLAGCVNFNTVITPENPNLDRNNQSGQNSPPGQNSPLDQNISPDQNNQAYETLDVMGLPDCGPAAVPDENNSGTFNPEADAAWSCLGQSILENCRGSRISIFSPQGSVVFGATTYQGRCYGLVQYGSDSGLYADANLQCPLDLNALSNPQTAAVPGTSAFGVYVMTAFKALSSDNGCTGTLLELIRDQNNWDFNAGMGA